MIQCPIIVGYNTILRDEKTTFDHVTMPQPPSNYGNDAAAKWNIEKLPIKQAAFQQMAYFLKTTAEINRVVALDMSSEYDLFDSDSLPEGSQAGPDFVTWILDRYKLCFSPDLVMNQVPHHVEVPFFYGFESKQLLRISGMDLIRHGDRVPVKYWYGYDHCYDPRDMLLETEAREWFGLEKLVREAPGSPLSFDPNFVPHRDPADDALVCLELCMRYQLAGISLSMTLVETAAELRTNVEKLVATPEDKKEPTMQETEPAL